MIYIEQETIEKARENMDKAFAAYKAVIDGPPLSRLAAWNEYKRAASDYRSFIRANYNL